MFVTAIFCIRSIHAGVAKLADALASGASGRKALGVQVPSSAPNLNDLVRHRESLMNALYGDRIFFEGRQRIQDRQDPEA